MTGILTTIWNTIGNILSPIIYGVLFASILAPLYDNLTKKMKKIWASIICLIIVLAAVAALALLIVPQVIKSLGTFVNQLPGYMEAMDKASEGFLNEFPMIKESVSDSYAGLNEGITSWLMGELIPNLTKFAGSLGSSIWSVLNGFKNFIIGVIIMVYLLNMKETLMAQGKKIIYSRNSVEKANTIIDDFRFAGDTFTAFISGKILDSIIIGCLTFIVLSIFAIPYSVLISVIVGVTNIIPFFGPFIGAIPCAFLLLLISPIKCLVFIIIILVIQQLDGNVIGPKILGDATGVPSFWVLIAILVFGGIFGIIGMIIAVPAFAVIFRICKRKVINRLEEKGMSTDTKDYADLDRIDAQTLEMLPKDHDNKNKKNVFFKKRRNKK